MRLAELSEGYMEAAVKLRLGLEETRAALEEAEGPERRALERKARMLEQMLREMRDLRRLTEGYYTRQRDGAYTTATLRAPRTDSLN